MNIANVPSAIGFIIWGILSAIITHLLFGCKGDEDAIAKPEVIMMLSDLIGESRALRDKAAGKQ